MAKCVGFENLQCQLWIFFSFDPISGFDKISHRSNYLFGILAKFRQIVNNQLILRFYHFFQFVILVVDSTDRDRLSITKDELHKMMGHEELSKANILVFANKQDVKGCLSAAEISKLLNLQSIRNHGWHIQACCALTGEGLYQGLEWIVNNIKKRWCVFTDSR